MASTPASVTAVMEALNKHFSGNTMVVAPVVTRLMLRTGVDVKSPRPDQQNDRAVLTKLGAELDAMGIPV